MDVDAVTEERQALALKLWVVFSRAHAAVEPDTEPTAAHVGAQEGVPAHLAVPVDVDRALGHGAVRPHGAGAADGPDVDGLVREIVPGDG